jgi:hypothetical protein
MVMKSLTLIAALILAVAMPPAANAVTLDLPATIKNEVNVTADSSPGWTPTAEQRHRALKTVQMFLDAVEGGRYIEAYGLQNELMKRNQTLPQFSQDAQKFSVMAGPVKFWRASLAQNAREGGCPRCPSLASNHARKRSACDGSGR